MNQPLLRARDVVDMAIQVERQGIAFYETCLTIKSKSFSDLKEVFDFLIREEKDHIVVFDSVKRLTPDESPLPESYPGEAQSYIHTFVKGQVFLSPKKARQQVRNMRNAANAIESAIKLAIGFEQQSILFYSALKQLVRKSEGETIDKVITAEHKHIKTLLELQLKQSQSGL